MAKLLDETQPDERERREGAAIVLDLRPVVSLTDEQFYDLCRANGELRIERTAEGEIEIMPPAGTKTGRRNSRLNQRLANWAEADGSGYVFDSSTAFKLPNGAVRSPDASWVRRERYDALTPEEQDKFSPICPDFVVELRSPTDAVENLQDKMEEYVAGGAQLGWLIDPFERKVYVYRARARVEVLENPEAVPGDPLLKGFVLNLRDIWCAVHNVNIELPDSLLRLAREFAGKEGVPLGQFIASALAEKMAAWRTVEYSKERAARGDRLKFQSAMNKVADVGPGEADRL